MHIIYVHFSGYCLFKIKEFEEIGHLIQSVRSSLNDLKKFSGIVKLESFQHFKDINEAYNCFHTIMNSKIPYSLYNFVGKYNFEKNEKIGLQFPQLYEEFRTKFDFKIVSHVGVTEIIRSIRCHIFKVLKKFPNSELDKMFLKSLSHIIVEKSLKVPLSGINITNNYNLLMELKKNFNMKLLNLKSVVQPFYPELANLFNSNDISLPRFLSIYFNENVNDKWLSIIENFGDDWAKTTKTLIDTTIGKEIPLMEMKLIKSISDDLLNFSNDIEKCELLTCNITKKVAPNLNYLLGESEFNSCRKDCDLRASKLISTAGSLKKLSELPSTTIHTLTFKDSLLRKGNFKSIPRSEKDKLLSKESKILSDKAALASRVDYFSAQYSDDYGKKLNYNFQCGLKNWAKTKGIKLDEKNETSIKINKFKLKRKLKKKIWLKKKKSNQRSGGYIELDLE